MMSEEVRTPAHVDGGDILLAIILRLDPNGNGHSPPTQFFTDPTLPMQVGMIHRRKDETIAAHMHPDRVREVKGHGEVLIVLDGTIEVTFYAPDGHQCDRRILVAGDVLIQVGGGHRFLAVEDFKILEVKTGPYSGTDKVLF